MKLIVSEEQMQREITDFSQAKSLLSDFGIEVSQIPLDENGNFVQDYAEFVEEFKTSENYISSDTVELTKSTGEEILDPFKKTHHHEDDEIRFTISGEGIFGIVPEEAKQAETKISEIQIICKKGDFIKVPAYTKHWFKLTEQHEMKCVRIFKENPKWEAIY